MRPWRSYANKAVCAARCCDPIPPPGRASKRSATTLIARIAEAESHRWYGEAEGLKVSLAGAHAKLAQMDQITAGRSNAVQLGIPSFTDTAGRATEPADERNKF